MDSRLQKRLERLEAQIERLRDAERIFLQLEAHKKVLAAQLFVKAEGKNVAEREAATFSSDDWITFSNAHYEAETDFNYERRRYELQLKAYDAEHLTLKTETPVIKRQGV